MRALGWWLGRRAMTCGRISVQCAASMNRRRSAARSIPDGAPCQVTNQHRQGSAHRTGLPSASVVPPSQSWLAAVRSLQQ